MPAEPQIGARYGPYLVQEVIARGGQGVVLRAHHSERQAPAALKLLFDERQVARRRFQREIETLRLLDHPRLPKPYDLGEHQGTLFIGLELIEGTSLHELVKLKGPLPELEALGLVADVAKTVAYCHSKGVVHRDLKPANVVVQEGTRAPYVVDFGIVRVEGRGVGAESRLSLTGDLIGTPAFMAPEGVGGGNVDAKADVYGLGAILYYLLCGQKPIEAATTLNVLTRLATAPTPDVRTANPAVSASIAELLLRAMAKDPDERTPDALTFAAELEALGAAPAPGQPRAGRPGLTWGLVILALSLLALAGVGLLSRGLGSSDQATPTRSAPSSPNEAEPTPSRWAPAPPLAAGAPMSSQWEFDSGGAIQDHRVLGPWVLVKVAPLDARGLPNRREGRSQLLSLASGEPLGAVPNGRLWTPDPDRARALCVSGGRLLGVRPGGAPEDLGPAAGVRSLTVVAEAIYVSTRAGFELRSPRGELQRTLHFEGWAEGAPLLLNANPESSSAADSEPDRLLLATTASQAHLLDLEGKLLSTLDLPGPTRFGPTLLSARPGKVEVGVVSGSGALARLRITPKRVELARAYDLPPGKGGRRLEPSGPLLATRPGADRPQEVYLPVTDRVVRLSPDLAELRWSARDPSRTRRAAIVAGLTLVDLNRDGIGEALATFLYSTGAARETSRALFDPQGAPRVVTTKGLGTRHTTRVRDGRALVQIGSSLYAWGPWTSLPPAQGTIRKQEAQALGKPGKFKKLGSKNIGFELEEAPGAPFQVTYGVVDPVTKTFRAKRTRGVFQAWLLGATPHPTDPGWFGRGTRWDTEFQLDPSFRASYAGAVLELDAQVRGGPGGLGFLAIAVEVNEVLLPRTRQLLVGDRTTRIPLGDLKAGSLLRLKVYFSTRSSLHARVKGMRLVFPD